MKKNRMIVVLVCLGFFWGVFASEDGLTVKQRMELIKQREKDAENAAAENAAQRKKGGGRRKSAKPSNEAKGGDGGGGGGSSRSESPESGDGDNVADGLAGGGSKVKGKEIKKILSPDQFLELENIYKENESVDYKEIIEAVKDKMQGSVVSPEEMVDFLNGRQLTVSNGVKRIVKAKNLFPEIVDKMVKMRSQASLDILNGIRLLVEATISQDEAKKKKKKSVKQSDSIAPQFTNFQNNQINMAIAMEAKKLEGQGLSPNIALSNATLRIGSNDSALIPCPFGSSRPAWNCEGCRPGFKELDPETHHGRWCAGWLIKPDYFAPGWGKEGYKQAYYKDNGIIKLLEPFDDFESLLKSLQAVGVNATYADEIFVKNVKDQQEHLFTPVDAIKMKDVFVGNYKVSYSSYEGSDAQYLTEILIKKGTVYSKSADQFQSDAASINVPVLAGSAPVISAKHKIRLVLHHNIVTIEVTDYDDLKKQAIALLKWNWVSLVSFNQRRLNQDEELTPEELAGIFEGEAWYVNRHTENNPIFVNKLRDPGERFDVTVVNDARNVQININNINSLVELHDGIQKNAEYLGVMNSDGSLKNYTLMRKNQKIITDRDFSIIDIDHQNTYSIVVSSDSVVQPKTKPFVAATQAANTQPVRQGVGAPAAQAQPVQQAQAAQSIQQAPVLRQSGNPADDLQRLWQMLSQLNQQAQSA